VVTLLDLHYWHIMKTLYLGPKYDLSHIEGDIVPSMDVAKLLEQRKVVAIFQGRSEARPRALGNRSILYDPRDPDGKDRINTIKRRRHSDPLQRVSSYLMHMSGLTWQG